MVIENELLKHQLAASPNLENLKQELQQGQSQIKELWSKSCDQVREFDMVIWEKDRE